MSRLAPACCAVATCCTPPALPLTGQLLCLLSYGHLLCLLCYGHLLCLLCYGHMLHSCCLATHRSAALPAVLWLCAAWLLPCHSQVSCFACCAVVTCCTPPALPLTGQLLCRLCYGHLLCLLCCGHMLHSTCLATHRSAALPATARH